MTTPTPTIDAARMPQITQDDREFLHDNPNTDDIVAWIHTYAHAYAAQQVAELQERLEAFAAINSELKDEIKSLYEQEPISPQQVAELEAKLEVAEKRFTNLADEAENVLYKFTSDAAWPFSKRMALALLRKALTPKETQ